MALSLSLLKLLLSVAFADRNEWMADADWADVPLEGLLDKEYLKLRSLLVNATKVVTTSRCSQDVGS